ncbi:MAG TPA: haloacid dehalogenase-like hydrolase [Solirubrobacteraceae bacterium]|nr:haloacid dehalogenase-like hydrolase [Solirubrobacteraceae bacterium]
MLLLFDIDGTLLAGATEAHREAMHLALRQVHGIEASERLRPSVNAAGRTDPEIARLILLLAGTPAKEIDERADDVRQTCCREYARLCPPDLSHTVIPGVSELLSSLDDEGFRLALLTGNFEAIARLKLARAGIGKHFEAGQGAFGSDSEDRTELPGIARRRAGEGGAPYPRKRTVVIGDTPLDIACARADRVRCVAVATGPYGVDGLRDADAVAADARELMGVLSRLA